MSDSYTLKTVCRNCGKTWDQEIPVGMTWQDALYQADWKHLRTPAAFGSHCGGCHQSFGDATSAGIFCKDCRFTSVSCVRCGSFNVEKVLPAQRIATKRKWYAHIITINSSMPDVQMSNKIEKDLLLVSDMSVLSICPFGGGLLMIAYEDMPIKPKEEKK